MPLLLMKSPAALLLAATLALAACGGGGDSSAPMAQGPGPEVIARYQPVMDSDRLIPAVDPGYLTGTNPRTEVMYTGPDAPGTVVVDPFARVLYLVGEGGMALRYGVAVGREGKGFVGTAIVGRKAEWPSWRPTDNMIRTEPERYAQYAAGLPGGLENPLGARAIYLYRGGRDTYYRIHGTNNSSTIGRATSAGCIRMFNQDVMDLYTRVGNGAQVRVRSLTESIAYEGEMAEGPTGLMVPMTSLAPEQQALARAGLPWWDEADIARAGPGMVPDPQVYGVTQPAPVLVPQG